jgi:hypothetical protein
MIANSLVALRVLVNLSTYGEKWTAAVLPSLSGTFNLLYYCYQEYANQTHPEGTPSSKVNHATAVLDHFSLVLALITNIIRQHPEARNAVQVPSMSMVPYMKLCSYASDLTLRLQALLTNVLLFVDPPVLSPTERNQ